MHNLGYPGSRWLKFDFHAHTPASDDYGRGEQSEPEGPSTARGFVDTVGSVLNAGGIPIPAHIDGQKACLKM